MFALGLSMTVAPLTNTVLGSVPQHNAGVASGANNAISRVAGLLAIAAVGAIVSAQFGSELDQELAGRQLTPAAHAAVREVKGRPLTGGVPRHPELDRAVEQASVHAYRVGLGVGGGLVIARRRDLADRDRQPGARALAAAARGARRVDARLPVPGAPTGGRDRPGELASPRMRLPVLTPRAYQRVAEVALAALTLIVFTGAAVRLTGSGLGCPDWPKCYGGVAPPLETHAWIEYGNRADLGRRRARGGRRGRAGVPAPAVPARPRACSACCSRSASSARPCSAASRSATTSSPAS